ncbi:MAG: hypothetical protein IPM29_07655 [Planctomycetes bacterium]|nr:hypothetical protein [Planctomycetota bacterium]
MLSRTSLLLSAIVATVAPLCSQATADVADDLVWTARGADVSAFDRFGDLRQSFNAGTAPAAVVTLPDGQLWLDFGNRIELRRADGAVLGSVAILGSSAAVAVDASGAAWVATVQPDALVRVDPTTLVASTATSFTARPIDVAVVASGDIAVVANGASGGVVYRYLVGGAGTATALLPASLGTPTVVEALPDGTVLVGSSNGSLGVVAASGVTAPVLPPLGAGSITDIALAPDGTVWVATTSSVHHVDLLTRTVRLLFATGVEHRLATDATGALWVLGSVFGRWDPIQSRIEVRATLPGTGPGQLLARPGLVHRATVVAPLADDDGDSVRNAVEMANGTNFLDVQSRPEGFLRVDRIELQSGDVLDIRAGGVGGYGALVFGTGYRLDLPVIPLLSGAPRLDPAGLLDVVVPVSVPGSYRTTVPPLGGSGSAVLHAQAIVGTLAPRLTDHVGQRLRPAQTFSIVDTFLTTRFVQTDRSSARRGTLGLVPGRIGGTGIDGSFDHTEGTDLGDGVFEWSTDRQTVGRTGRSLFGASRVVSDGRFDFTDFTIPAGVTVRFVGVNPARISVAGRCRIDGVLDVSGADVADGHDGKNSDPTGGPGGTFRHGQGQAGSRGGPAAGSGGDGAWACDGAGNPTRPTLNDFAGYDGEDLHIPGDHLYAGLGARTGGRGAALFPAHGDATRLVYAGFGGIYAVEAAAGGGGGGFTLAGIDGTCTLAGFILGSPPNTNPAQRGGPTPGGVALPFIPPPGGRTSRNHYAIGGSGGGGGGSQPTFGQVNPIADPVRFWSAAAGAGGGGVLQLGVGTALDVTPGAAITARGGSGTFTAQPFTVAALGVPCPGGGGSGGTLLLQVDGGVSQLGTLDVRGGEGGNAVLTGFFNLDVRGGRGAPGVLRAEVPNPAGLAIGNALPAPTPDTVGPLLDFDAATIALLGPYAANLAAIPVFRSYRIEATVDGRNEIWSDDAALLRPANVLGAPIRAWFRSVSSITGARGPWRDWVNPRFGTAIGADRGDSVEVLIRFDRTVVQSIEVTRLEIAYGD